MAAMSQVLAGPGREPQLFELINSELRRLARACMRRERADHTLQPTALVNEAFLRMSGGGHVAWEDRAHFLATAARVMRQILVDYARGRRAAKRTGDRNRVELNDSMAISESNPELLLAIDAALDGLRELDQRAADVVEMRFFAGLTVDETAEALSLSQKTVKRDWEFARAWFRQQLGSGI